MSLFNVQYFMVIIKVKGIVLTFGLIWTDGYHCPPKATATLPQSTAEHQFLPLLYCCHLTLQQCGMLHHTILTSNIICYQTILVPYHTKQYHTSAIPLPYESPRCLLLSVYSQIGSISLRPRHIVLNKKQQTSKESKHKHKDTYKQIYYI